MNPVAYQLAARELMRAGLHLYELGKDHPFVAAGLIAGWLVQAAYHLRQPESFVAVVVGMVVGLLAQGWYEERERT